MDDKLIIATAHDNDIRIIAAITTQLVNKATKIHNTKPTASAALGRMLTAGSLMGVMLKNAQDSLTIHISGGGIAGGVIVTSYSDAHVKGYIVNPDADLPPNKVDKLDVGGIIGTDGTLTVIKDMGLKEPYIGKVPICTGEIGDDIAYYFTTSEQTPSAVGLGVLVDKNLTIKASGGFIIQMMPGSDEMLADIITYRLQEIPPITEMISSGKSIEDILNSIFDDMDLKILSQVVPEFRCDCSRKRVEKALISIGKDELASIYEENKTEEIMCDFCNTKYLFDHNSLGKIISSL